MIRHHAVPRTAWDIWRAGQAEEQALAARQQARLTDLVRFARAHSPFYARLYSRLPAAVRDIREVPPVTKGGLMAHFDAWSTDRAVTRASVAAFVADARLAGQPYLGRYAIWTTSGVTGTPGFFVHDGDALAIYGILAAMRGLRAWLAPSHLWALARRGVREVSVVATGGHFAGAALMAQLQRVHPWLARRSRTLSVQAPVHDLVPALNQLQPTVLISYPTVITLLAHERRAGRLQIDPVLLVTAAEWLAPAARDQLASTFSGRIRDVYAASECMGIAYDCGHGWLHVNADWVILEPVDAAYQAVPPGQASHTTLLTNLANRVQPIIRYDLGDSITLNPDPCPCGSRLPAIRVEGRRDEILYVQAPSGEAVPLLPMALAAAVEHVAGVRRFQVIQTGRAALTLRLDVAPGADAFPVWEGVCARLRAYLTAQGLPRVSIERAPEPPRRDPTSGKFRQVWTRQDASGSRAGTDVRDGV
jgi:phenylacetate-coenzyme A ligase PaaK-like adenylate-forming protein